MKFNLRNIMLRAWELFRKFKDLSFGECLHRAWLSAKALEINAKRIEDTKTAAGVTEKNCNLELRQNMFFEVNTGLLVLNKDNPKYESYKDLAESCLLQGGFFMQKKLCKSCV